MTTNGWAPARHVLPPVPYSADRPGKALGADPAQAGGLEKFFADPTLAFITSIVAAGASAYLGYGLNVMREVAIKKVSRGEITAQQVPGTTWSTFWWIMATAMGVKALHDLSRTQR